MKTQLIFLLACSMAAIAAGCRVTREFKTYGELRDANPSSIRVMAKDTTVYELSPFTMTDSSVQGSGVHIVRGDRSSFSGSLPLHDLVYIQGTEGNFFLTVAGGSVAIATAVLIGSSMNHPGLNIWRPQGSSCPYVYAWDGSRHVLQGEMFGTSFGKGLESSTTCVLPAATDRDNVVRIRMTNERPETHYVNSAALFAYDVPNGSHLCLDTGNRGWVITDPQPPIVSAPEILKCDGVWWKSDLRSTRLGGSFRDEIEITLPRKPGSTNGSLVVHAINTRLISAVYDVVFGYLGDESLRFLHQVENDPQLIAELRGWIRECSLKLEIWKDNRWVEAGLIPPEANDVPFTRVVRVDAGGIQADEIRIRMSSLADSWMIDGVEIDWTDVTPLKPHRVSLRSAQHSVRGSVNEALNESDASYVLVLPGESIDMEFDPFRGERSGHLQYAFAARGYLYEWLPDSKSSAPAQAMFASLGSDRVVVAHSLVQHREAFLWPLFQRWKEIIEERPELRRAPGE